MRILKIALPILYLLSPLVPLAVYLRYNWYSFFHLYSLSVVAGISGYTYFLNQFITGARIKILDRLYGYDRVLLFHRYTAILAFMLIIAHSQTKDVPHTLQVNLGVAAISIFLAVIVLALLFLSDALSHISLFGRLRTWVAQRLKLQYQHFRVIHNLTAIAMAIALAHVLLASSTRESPYRFAVMALWYCGAMGVYIRHKYIHPRARRRNSFEVTQIINEAPQVVTLELTRPKPLIYRPGQFCFVKFLSGEMGRDEHPYTISSTPHSDRLTITVKNCGDWSGALATRARSGDRVAIDGAYGIFSHTKLPSAKRAAPLVFIAGGIGITPCMSMLATLAVEKADRSILLIWKVRAQEELIFSRARANWKKVLPNLRTALFVSAKQKERITAEKMCATSLTDAELKSGQYFMCGPSSLIRECQRYLRHRGVRRSQIHYENFGF